MSIISVSRRTDVPAFFGDWFMDALSIGSVTVKHPKTFKEYPVRLDKHDVFVFWSKNYTPFLASLHELKDHGYMAYFNYTINNYPSTLEANVDHRGAVRAARVISRMYSPDSISWRYDPIIVSNITDYNWHLDNFASLCSKLSGYVQRCYFKFNVVYGKVARNLEALQRTAGVTVSDPCKATKIKLANDLADIANNHGIKMYSCCSDFLLGHNNISKAHCVDGDIIERLYGNGIGTGLRPTRMGCGCTDSIDIGTYNTCKHGCVYCYANTTSATIKSILSSNYRGF